MHNEHLFSAQGDSQLTSSTPGTEIRWDSVLSLISILSRRTITEELSTNDHLIVCILRGLNHPRTRKQLRPQGVSYRIKWELLADKKVRHTFASKIAFLFRELSDYSEDVETVWDLFKSAVITSSAATCGCRRVEGQMGSEKRTARWNQEAIRAYKTGFRAWLTNKSSE